VEFNYFKHKSIAEIAVFARKGEPRKIFVTSLYKKHWEF